MPRFEDSSSSNHKGPRADFLFVLSNLTFFVAASLDLGIQIVEYFKRIERHTHMYLDGIVLGFYFLCALFGVSASTLALTRQNSRRTKKNQELIENCGLADPVYLTFIGFILFLVAIMWEIFFRFVYIRGDMTYRSFFYNVGADTMLLLSSVCFLFSGRFYAEEHNLDISIIKSRNCCNEKSEETHMVWTAMGDWCFFWGIVGVLFYNTIQWSLPNDFPGYPRTTETFLWLLCAIFYIIPWLMERNSKLMKDFSARNVRIV